MNQDDLEFLIDCLESRVWELGVDTKNGNPLDPSIAYKKGKIDARKIYISSVGREVSAPFC